MHLLTKSIKESLKKNDWFTALFISLLGTPQKIYSMIKSAPAKHFSLS